MWILWLILGITLTIAAIGILLFLFRKRLDRFAAAIQYERARESFKLQQTRLHEIYFQRAAATGQPRGLLWSSCEWPPHIEFVADKNTGHIVAFAAVTIHFAAIEGGDMEGVQAVGLPRAATAVFYFHRGHWETNGAAIMNNNPDEAADRFPEQYERLGAAAFESVPQSSG